MEKDHHHHHQVIAVNDAVHKLQLAMLDGVTDQNQLFAAGTLMSRSEYEDVVTERTIAKLCGYPLCLNSLPSDVSQRGKYRISLKEHRVYDLVETRKFCSADCLISSRSFSVTLQEARSSDFDDVKVNHVLGLFCDSNAKDSLSDSEDLALAKLTIRENVDVGSGEMSLEQWMGPSNAVEGYVPIDRSNSKSRIGQKGKFYTKANQEKNNDPLSSENDFTSTIIITDEFNVPKLPSQTNQASPIGRSADGKGKSVLKEQTSVPTTKNKSRFLRERKKDKKNIGFDLASFGFDGMGCASSDLTNDRYSFEYSVSKQPPRSAEDPLGGQSKEDLKTLDEKLGKKDISIEYHANPCEDSEEIVTAESSKGLKAGDVGSSSETVTKSCLKNSGSKKLNYSVTWADKNGGHGDLCEVESNDTEAGLNLSSTDQEDANSVSRLALAEACAAALSQAAEAVSSGDLDASDAAAKAGIVLLPSTHQLEEEVVVLLPSTHELDEEISEEDSEEEPTLLKWPNKPGIPDSDLFDRDQSWFDGPPEGFNLTLSSFATMWDALFGWVSSSSLAYIYGKDESAHEEFLSVNGKEYPRKVIMGEGLSSEIKSTLAGCLARALPRVQNALSLRISISVLEKGLGRLLETMSLTGAVPSFRTEQWLVIVLLFLDALSVSRLPMIAHVLSNKNKVLGESGIGSEEYETMKDILLPLGRVPQFRSSA
ncbi:unnamed protein product [Cochlearia groenlandica]